MPNSTDHLNLANKNKSTRTYLMQAENGHTPWIATIAFYEALHLVDALLFTDSPGCQHGGDHRNRSHVLKTVPRFRPIHKHYCHLFEASRVARYLEITTNSNSSSYSSFEDYMDSKTVEDEIVNTHLEAIRTKVIKVLVARKVISAKQAP